MSPCATSFCDPPQRCPAPGRRREPPGAQYRWLVGLLAALVGTASCAPWYRDEELRGLEATDHETLGALVAEGDAHLAAGRPAEAEERYAAAARRNARFSPALVGLTRALLAQGRREEALAAARFAMAAKDADPAVTRELRPLLFRDYVEQGLYPLALDYLGDAAEVPAIGTVLTVRELGPIYGKLGEAHALARSGEAERALERYAEWLRDYGIPDHRFVRQWSDELLESCTARVAGRLDLGAAALATGHPLEALLHYAVAFRYLPSTRFDDGSRSKLAEAAARLPDPAPLRRAASDLAALGDAALARGKLGPALAAYRQAVAAAPHVAELRYNLAHLLGHLGLYAEAARQLDWYLALAPQAPNEPRARAQRDRWKSAAEATP